MAHIQHEFEAIAWLSGKPVPPCHSTCNNARVMAVLLSSAELMLSFFRNPESMAKAILDLPIEFEFSSAAGGANVGYHSLSHRKPQE
jgi:hypothetical protein